MADLSRGVVGVRDGSLIVNLPGSPTGALESLEAIEAVLDHALETLAGPYDHGVTRPAEGDPCQLMFEPFADVPAYPLVFPVFWGAAVFFALAMARHLRVFAAARPSAPFADLPARLVGLVQYAFVQTKMFKDPRAGLMHAGIFWGFVLLTIGTADIVTGGRHPDRPRGAVRRRDLGGRQRDAERGRAGGHRLDRLGVRATAGDPSRRG